VDRIRPPVESADLQKAKDRISGLWSVVGGQSLGARVAVNLRPLRAAGLNNIAQGPLTTAFMYPFRGQILNVGRSGTRGGATPAPGWFI
jgi:hypothetical protein